MNIRFLFAYVPSSAWIQEHETISIGNVILFPGFNSVTEICWSFEMSLGGGKKEIKLSSLCMKMAMLMCPMPKVK